MALEDLTGSKTIEALDRNNPVGGLSGDKKKFGDDHLRGIKNVILNTLPNVAGVIDASHIDLNSAIPWVLLILPDMDGSSGSGVTVGAPAGSFLGVGTINAAGKIESRANILADTDMQAKGALQVGSPTGGFLGTGTINAAGTIQTSAGFIASTAGLNSIRFSNTVSVGAINFFQVFANNSAATSIEYLRTVTSILINTAGAEQGQYRIDVITAGVLTSQIFIANGMQVGAPAGGFLGTGTINAAGKIESRANILADTDMQAKGALQVGLPAGGFLGTGTINAAGKIESRANILADTDMQAKGALQVGLPAGGFLGAGTINAAGKIESRANILADTDMQAKGALQVGLPAGGFLGVGTINAAGKIESRANILADTDMQANGALISRRSSLPMASLRLETLQNSGDVGVTIAKGLDSLAGEVEYSRIQTGIIDNTTGAHIGEIALMPAVVNGIPSITQSVRISEGMRVGVPSLGYLGVGSIAAEKVISSETELRCESSSFAYVRLRRTTATTVDNIAVIQFFARDSAATDLTVGSITMQTPVNTAGAVDAEYIFTAVRGGTEASQFRIGGGVLIGNPTGGYKGAGTLNVAGDIFKNNTAYTNPDYVFDVEYGGESENYPGRVKNIPDLKAHVVKHHRLPGMDDDPAGLFGRVDKLLEKLEEAYLYIFDLEARLARVEDLLAD